jgi:serine/threonine protein kinase
MHLSHPNICPIYEFGDSNGRFFIAMEWVRGVALFELLEHSLDRLPIPFVVKIFVDIAGALHHAHTCTDQSGRALSIVHRDVSPENIMIGFDGVPKLLDFGVAKAATQKHRTEAGNLKGKFAYISPEQYQGLPLDGRSDVFSLGVCLYEALTGRPLYDRANEYETVAAIVLDPEVPSVRDTRPEVPAELDALVQRALAKDREERVQSADELAEALLAFAMKSNASLRQTDVARTLRELVPEMVNAEPTLDRKPIASVASPVVAKPERRTGGEIDDLLLSVEAEKETEEIFGAQRRRNRLIAVFGALVILLSLAVIGWVVLRPRLADYGIGGITGPGSGSERPDHSGGMQ